MFPIIVSFCVRKFISLYFVVAFCCCAMMKLFPQYLFFTFLQKESLFVYFEWDELCGGGRRGHGGKVKFESIENEINEYELNLTASCISDHFSFISSSVRLPNKQTSKTNKLAQVPII